MNSFNSMKRCLAESKAKLPKVLIRTTPHSALMTSVMELVKHQDLFWCFYLKLIQTRQDASLGDHDLRNFGRVMRGITEDNNFQFLLQVDAIKDNTFSRLLCYSDCDHFVPHNVVCLSNIYTKM